MVTTPEAARQWLGKAEKLRSDLAVVDAIDEQDLVATRARTLESCAQIREALEHAAKDASASSLCQAVLTAAFDFEKRRWLGRKAPREDMTALALVRS